MRKFFLAAAVALLTLTVAAPAMAIDFKMTGLFWWENATGDDGDRNSRTHDSKQFGRFLMRPRFHAVAEGGKLWGMIEYDIAPAGFRTVGRQPRANLFGNRFIVDFLIPGTQLRFRFGRTDWLGPNKESMGSFKGLTRRPGLGLYGKLTKNLFLNFHDMKYGESNNADSPNRNTGISASDKDVYHLKLTYKASPTLSIAPFVFWDHANGVNAGDQFASGGPRPGFNIFWYGAHVSGKVGNFSYKAWGMIQDGDIEFSRGDNRADIDIEAWAAFLRTWLTMGKFKLGFYASFTSGDDDTTDQVGGGSRGMTGRQADNQLKRFATPRQNTQGWADGPQLITEFRWTTMPFYKFASRNGTGNGDLSGNGLQFYELLGKYAVTKKFNLEGNVSIIRTSAKRPDIDANFDGDTTDPGDATFDSAKDIGTEIDIAGIYKIYKNLTGLLVFSYLFAGDYGIQNTSGGTVLIARDFDDTWALFFLMKYTF